MGLCSIRAAQLPSAPFSCGVVGKSCLKISSEQEGSSSCGLVSPSKMSLWVFIWCVGVTAGEGEATRCWCLNRRWQAGDVRTAFLVWTSLVPLALQSSHSLRCSWELLSLPIEFSQCFPQPPAWSGSLLSCALFLSSLSRAGRGRREANEMQAPFGMENREIAWRAGPAVVSHCFNSVLVREREHFFASPLTEVPREILGNK